MVLFRAAVQAIFPDEGPRDLRYTAQDRRMATMGYMEAQRDKYGPILAAVADTLRLPPLPENTDAVDWAL